MNRRMGEGGEGDAGIKRNILRPEIRGNTKRNSELHPERQ